MTVLKPKILIVDKISPYAYSGKTLRYEAMGGTEATVVRVAEALANEFDVRVVQLKRLETEKYQEVSYEPYEELNVKGSRELATIVVRDPSEAVKLAFHKQGHHNHRVWLWCHDLFDLNILGKIAPMASNNVGVICVSKWHRMQLVDLIRHTETINKFPEITHIYNPIDDDLQASTAPKIDHNKLVFMSSPHKGLDYAVDIFETMRKEFNKDFKFYTFNPGYYQTKYYPKDNGVVTMGPTPHIGVVNNVRDALCVFYPNTVFPETFGLVLAEANAVGTPVITHPFGAAPEVLGDVRQLVDCRDRKKLIDRVMEWKNGNRPQVRGQEMFRMKNVVQAWRKLLLSDVRRR